MVDDGSGTKEVCRVLDKKLVPVPLVDHGKFYAGDCYVINYAYTVGGTEKNIIYYWLVTNHLKTSPTISVTNYKLCFYKRVLLQAKMKKALPLS